MARGAALGTARAPRRRCVGCGRSAPKPELVRIALEGATAARGRRAVLDRDGTMPGRGAYLCRGERAGEPARDCLALALRRGAVARSLRCAVTLPDELVESVRMAQPTQSRLAETGTHAEGARHLASAGLLDQSEHST